MLLAPAIVHPFKAPKKSLKSLEADVVGLLVAAAADLALVVDRRGVITDMAFSNDELAREGTGSWIGQHWIDTVTVESRPKIEEMLSEASTGALPRPRQVNHLAPAGKTIAVRYSAVPLGQDGRIIAVGRDLLAVTMLQQRLVDAQQSMEREYMRLRAVEGRYRFLFQMTSEPILVVDATSLKVVEANAAAGQLFCGNGKRLTGQTLRQLLTPTAAQAVEGMLSRVRAVGRADDIKVEVGDEPKHELMVTASLFRQDGSTHYLVRLSPAGTAAQGKATPSDSNLRRVLEAVPDGFVVTDLEGHILSANSAFLELINLVSEEQAHGEPLERFLGRAGVDFNVLVANLKEHGSVRRFASTIRGEFGISSDVEISGVHVPDGSPPCFGFIVHLAGRPPQSATRVDAPRSIEQMKELIGRVPLKDVVRETTDVIERLCIEAALELTGDNRASAAEMLGLSRQSLYGKLRRFGMGGLGATDE